MKALAILLMLGPLLVPAYAQDHYSVLVGPSGRIIERSVTTKDGTTYYSDGAGIPTGTSRPGVNGDRYLYDSQGRPAGTLKQKQ